MRVGVLGLPVLIVTSLLVAGAPAAHAADEGPVGVVDDVVVVRARETLPGQSGGGGGGDGEAECVWVVVIDDDQRMGVYDFDGERLYSDTGRWFQRDCGFGPIEINGFFVVPEGGGFSVPDLLAQAINALDPAAPGWGASPDGVAVPMVTQMPVWLWVEPGYWSGRFAARAETPSGRMWAEAVAVPASTSWNPGDGTTVQCANGGEVFRDGAEPAACSHVYRHSTSASGPIPVTVTVTFNVMATTSLNPTPAFEGQIARSSAPVAVSVGEIQAIETGEI